jgi:hypothetical protein
MQFGFFLIFGHSLNLDGRDYRTYQHPFEAAARGIAEMHKAELIEYQLGPSTTLRVEVRQPTTTHVVPFQHVRAWLKRSGSPHEQARKARSPSAT